MRLQSSQANCGPFAVRNALSALGVSRSEQECESLCKVTGTHGTRARDLVRGLAAIESVMPSCIDETRRDVGLLRLDAALRAGRPAILLVDAWSHYVAAVGVLGNRYLVADSADSELVVSVDVAGLATWWGCEGARRPYWGVIL